MDAGFVELKSEQLKAIVEFVRGREVFVSLPTGFVKSLIYGLIPALRAILPPGFSSRSLQKIVGILYKPHSLPRTPAAGLALQITGSHCWR